MGKWKENAMKIKALFCALLVSVGVVSSTVSQVSQQALVYEIKTLEEELYQEDNTEHIVLENFTDVIQHFFHILNHAQNPEAVAHDMSHILSQVVHISLEVVNNLPSTILQENRLAFIDVIAQTLKAKLALLDKAKNCFLLSYDSTL